MISSESENLIKSGSRPRITYIFLLGWLRASFCLPVADPIHKSNNEIIHSPLGTSWTVSYIQWSLHFKLPWILLQLWRPLLSSSLFPGWVASWEKKKSFLCSFWLVFFPLLLWPKCAVRGSLQSCLPIQVLPLTAACKIQSFYLWSEPSSQGTVCILTFSEICNLWAMLLSTFWSFVCFCSIVFLSHECCHISMLAFILKTVTFTSVHYVAGFLWNLPSQQTTSSSVQYSLVDPHNRSKVWWSFNVFTVYKF